MKREELIRLRTQCIDRANALAKKPDLTEAEQAEFDKNIAEAEKHSQAIEAMDARAAKLATLNAAAERLEPVVGQQTGELVRPAEPALPAHAVTGAGARPNLLNDPKRGFKSMNEQLRAIQQAAATHIVDERLRISQAASGMNESSGPDGGYAVAPEFETAIWDKLNSMDNSLMNEVDVLPMNSNKKIVNGNGETSKVSGSRYGGMTGAWLGEAGAGTYTKPKMRQIELNAHKFGVFVPVTDELREDCPGAEQFMMNGAADIINFEINEAIINGNGVAKPLGILNAASTVTVAKEGSQAADTIVSNNIDNMYARMHPQALFGARWYYSQDIYPQLAKLNRAVGTGGALVYSGPNGMADAPFGRLLGLPMIPLENCKVLGDAGDLILWNPKFYLLGRRGGVKMAQSMHVLFLTEEEVFRWTVRIDGQPWLASPITPANGGATLSPAVILAARA